jgi:N-ethylmaleimide reductase
MSTKQPDLFSPLRLGSLDCKNRVAMAPLTRSRASPGNVPNSLNALYYAQRASAGLIISEATQISPEGQGYISTPGIHSAQQIEGWKIVTKAVHVAGGCIVLQLWHVGRISHPSFQPNGELPIAPSAIKPNAQAYTQQGFEPVPTPRALETREIPGVIQQFAKATQNAMEAGFDGVEVHAANGYLIDQFLQDNSNHRTDQYGGSIENRARLLLEVVAALVSVWGDGRVAVRIGPAGKWNDMNDSDPNMLFTFVAEQLNRFNLAYLHIIEPRVKGNIVVAEGQGAIASEQLREVFKGNIVAAGGFEPDTAEAIVEADNAEAVAFGRHFISNPDLPLRIQESLPLIPYDRDTFYTFDARGYIDYVPYAEVTA